MLSCVWLSDVLLSTSMMSRCASYVRHSETQCCEVARQTHVRHRFWNRLQAQHDIWTRGSQDAAQNMSAPKPILYVLRKRRILLCTTWLFHSFPLLIEIKVYLKQSFSQNLWIAIIATYLNIINYCTLLSQRRCVPQWMTFEKIHRLLFLNAPASKCSSVLASRMHRSTTAEAVSNARPVSASGTP